MASTTALVAMAFALVAAVLAGGTTTALLIIARDKNADLRVTNATQALAITTADAKVEQITAQGVEDHDRYERLIADLKTEAAEIGKNLDACEAAGTPHDPRDALRGLLVKLQAAPGPAAGAPGVLTGGAAAGGPAALGVDAHKG